MILRIVYAIIIWILAALGFYLLGGLLVAVGQPTLSGIGAFLRDNSVVIGFLFGLLYFIFSWPSRPTIRPA